MEKLNLEKIKSLSDAELGQVLIDLCKFPVDEQTPIPDLYQIGHDCYYPHQLCADLNAIAEVEKIAINDDDGHTYFDALRDVVAWESANARHIIIASARGRAEASLLALQEKE